MPRRHPSLELDCQRVDLEPERLRQIADEVAARLVEALRIDGAAPVRVSVLDGPNDATQHCIRVSPRTGGGLSVYEWFELLFAHELTHVLVEDHWGIAPVLVWEGVPIWLGDAHVRARVLGRSYHAYCRALRSKPVGCLASLGRGAGDARALGWGLAGTRAGMACLAMCGVSPGRCLGRATGRPGLRRGSTPDPALRSLLLSAA